MPVQYWVPLLYAAAVVILGATYVWSENPGRRKRAMVLLRRLFGRR